MNKKWIGTQIVLNNTPNMADNLKKTLTKAKEILDLNALIVWSDTDKKFFNLVKDICAEFKIKTYLWYPVLADTPGFKIEQEQAVKTFDGLRGHGKLGCWEKMGKGEEDFLFLCPNDEENINKIFNRYEIKIKESGFDGVFLDRIRFPSPSNGFEALFSCFCTSCKDKFYHDFGEDLDVYQNRIKSLFAKIKTIDSNYLENCHSFSEIIFQDDLKKFYDFRKQSVYRMVKMFANKAKQMNKLVGIDLFAPSFAPLVSQDYKLLAKTCDWIKPMIYCHTSSPAGIPLELYSFLRAILEINPALNENELMCKASPLTGVALPVNLEKLLINGISEYMICSEMEKIKELDLPESVNIYVGLEAVQIPGLCNITEKILKKYLKSVIEADTKGIILSWDLLKIPEENLKIVGEFLSKQ